MAHIPRATIDFETRSAISLRTCGPWRYSIDPSTDILCMAFRLPHWESGRTGLWHHDWPTMNIEEPDDYSDCLELIEWIQAGGLVEAHNVWFEFSLWNNVLMPRYGWPAIGARQWRCTAAKASAHALPRKLGEAATALRLRLKKDTAKTETTGVRVLKQVHVVRKVSQPRKLRKAEREWFLALDLDEPDTNWHEEPDQFWRLCDYCRQDVLAEEALSFALDDLNAHETEIFLADMQWNHRGFQLDQEAVETALTLIAEESEALNAELAVVTDGYVTKATQRKNMMVWLESEGVVFADTTAATLDAALAGSALTGSPRRAVELMRTLGRSSTAKYQRMRDWAGEDWRVRGGLLYHGASTGRWSGAGIQPHNFPKGSVKEKQDELWRALKTQDRQDIATTLKAVAKVEGGAIEALSQGLRGTIIPSDAHTLYVADFASIEARVLLWLADDQDGLDLFRNHQDVYCDMAASIYHRPVTKEDATERGMGKIAILGLGYQMGAEKFADTCAKFGITIPVDTYCEECGKAMHQHRKADHEFDGDTETMTAAKVVTAYRLKYWRVKQLWADIEAGAIAAVESRAKVDIANVVWFVQGNFLYCELPSGRRLAYPFPRVEVKTTSWGAQKPTLTYMGVNPMTRQWTRQMSYGGLLVENIVQAESRDLMADGALRAEAAGYMIVLTVHDELLAEAPDGMGSVREFEGLMAATPDWAEGCPVEAEGWSGKRYRK